MSLERLAVKRVLHRREFMLMARRVLAKANVDCQRSASAGGQTPRGDCVELRIQMVVAGRA